MSIVMSKSKNITATAKTATAKTTEKTVVTATANNEKVNNILNIDEVKKLFVECNVLPKYTDKVHYVGCGVRSNVCSVNVLKTKYNIYCDDIVFDTLNNNRINDCIYTANGNINDKNRPNTIEVNTTDNLKKLLTTVANNYKMYTIA